MQLSRPHVAHFRENGAVGGRPLGRLGTPTADPQPTDRGVKYPPTEGAGAVAVLAAGVDYLTCTAATPARAELLRALGQQIAYKEAEAGNDLRPWLWKGYDGIVSGSCSVGARGDGSIVRLSSECAAANWRRLAQVSEHVSRLDLAVTVRLDPEANPAAEAYQTTGPTTAPRRGRRIQHATHIETRTEGETCYLGSRQSDRYGRLYNKGLESKLEVYRDAWRWEVEYKGDAATPTALSVAQCGSEQEAVLAHVWDAFASWGCDPIWGIGADVSPFHDGRAPSDDERRLAWLYTQVRPAVARLRARGRLSEVLSALGLDDIIQEG